MLYVLMNMKEVVRGEKEEDDEENEVPSFLR